MGYRLSGGFDANRPTMVLINSMCTTTSLYNSQFDDAVLTAAMNLLAVEPLGHGATRTTANQWTYWDSAAAILQAMTALGVTKAFALGTSQGGWIAVRMALLAPERILGVLPLGTSLDYESADSRAKGCWDPKTLLRPFYDKWSSPHPTPDFVVDDVWCAMVASIGFGAAVSDETVSFWKKTVAECYAGDDGRMRLRMALICLLERDGLLMRLSDVKCPVHWLQVSRVESSRVELRRRDEDSQICHNYVVFSQHVLAAVRTAGLTYPSSSPKRRVRKTSHTERQCNQSSSSCSPAPTRQK